MKIIKLQIENIASLKGKHVIDFQNIFQHSGVFAITGETGSGKSTLLNCISLALYGVNYKNNRNRDFVTLGESFGEIELIFSFQQNIYKAHWLFKLLKNDGTEYKAPKPERHFYRYEGDQWIALSETPEKIINLTFDQFTKTIILNQGEFAKFLTSSFKDRKDILAKLYDEDKLEALSIHVKRKITQIDQSIQNLQSQITGLDEISALDLDLAQKLVQEDKAKLKHTQSYLDLFEKIKKTFQDLQQYRELWAKNNGQIDKTTQNILLATNEVNQHKLAEDDIIKKINEIKSTIETREPILIKAIGQVNLLNDLIQENTKLTSQQSEFDHELEAQQKNILKLQDIKRIAQIKLMQLTQDKDFFDISETDRLTLEKLYKQSLESKNQLILIDKDLFFEKQKQTTTKDQIVEIKKALIEKQNLLGQINLDKTKEKLNNTTDDHQIYTKAQLSLEHYKSANKNITGQIIQNEKNLNEVNTKIKQADDVAEEYKNQIADIRLALRSYELQMEINHIAQESLMQGHCLVCHNNDLAQVKTHEHNVEQEQIQKLQERLLQKEKLHHEALLEVNSHRNSQMHFRSNLQEIRHKKLELTTSITGAYTFINSNDVTDHLDETVKKISTKLASLTEMKRILEDNYQQAVVLKQQIEDIQKDLTYKSDFEKEATQIVTLLEQKKQKIQLTIDSLNASFKELLPEFTYDSNLEKTLNLANQKILLQNEIDHHDKLITSINAQIDRLNKLIEQTQQSLQNNKSKQEAIHYFIKEHNITNPQNELEELKKNSSNLQQQHERLTNQILNFNTHIIEENSKLKTYQEQNEQTEHMFKTLWTSFLSLITAKNLKNEQLEREPDLYVHIHQFFERIQKSPSIQEITLEILSATSNHIDQLYQGLSQLKMQTQTHITRYQTLIDQKLQAKDKIEALAKTIKLNQAEKQKLTNLYELVGKDEFRNFVLALIEKNLIIQTNHELQNLCGDRYQIEHMSKNSSESPDFYVIDKIKGGLTRKISTLSGGETFMVSLAMAMALSELTRGSSEIDSFFIDEGFGTLDEDSLEDVLEMIQTMENRGKSIGLISHIKRLTDRINVNIRLEKTNLGNSSIKVLYL